MSTTDVDRLGESDVRSDLADLKFEAVVIPVSDVERSKAFYAGLGWRLDADFAFDNGFRVVQFTPPGSGASVQFGTNISTAAPGSAQGLYLVVSDIQAACQDLATHGAPVSEVFHPGAPGGQFEPEGLVARAAGADEHHASYGSFATFHDPDGNTWLLQEVTTRLPGRIDAQGTSYASIADLASAMRHAHRSPTVRTRLGSARPIRTGPTGTPPTWSPSKPARRCRSKHTAQRSVMSTIKIHHDDDRHAGAVHRRAHRLRTRPVEDLRQQRRQLLEGPRQGRGSRRRHRGFWWRLGAPALRLVRPQPRRRDDGRLQRVVASRVTRTRTSAARTARPTSTTWSYGRGRTSRAGSSASSSDPSARAGL